MKLFELFKNKVMTDVVRGVTSGKKFEKKEPRKEVKENIISKEEKDKIIATLPKFEYNPYLYESDYVTFKDAVCKCCGKEVKAYVEGEICLDCIKDGSAFEKGLWSGIEDHDPISDDEKTKILEERTAGYNTLQQLYWLQCCDDFCEFKGYVGIGELNKLGITDEVINEYCERFQLNCQDFLKANLAAKGAVRGYLYKCKHCGKYHLFVDMN